jgi:hypothetical protein
MLFIPILTLLSCSGVLSLSSEHGGYLAPLEGMDNHDKYPDEYVVIFHKNHTLEQHSDTIGYNVSSLPGFSRYGFGYGAIMDDKIRDERVRRDPGVRMVETDGPVYAIRPDEMVLFEPDEMVLFENLELSNNQI